MLNVKWHYPEIQNGAIPYYNIYITFYNKLQHCINVIIWNNTVRNNL